MGARRARTIARLGTAPVVRSTVLAVAMLLLLVAGIAATSTDLPSVRSPDAAASNLGGCMSARGPLTVSWRVDPTRSTPPVTGLTLGNVPPACAARGITVRILDARNRTIAEATSRPGTTATTVTFDFSTFRDPALYPRTGITGVYIPPIDSVRAEVPSGTASRQGPD